MYCTDTAKVLAPGAQSLFQKGQGAPKERLLFSGPSFSSPPSKFPFQVFVLVPFQGLLFLELALSFVNWFPLFLVGASADRAGGGRAAEPGRGLPGPGTCAGCHSGRSVNWTRSRATVSRFPFAAL